MDLNQLLQQLTGQSPAAPAVDTPPPVADIPGQTPVQTKQDDLAMQIMKTGQLPEVVDPLTMTKLYQHGWLQKYGATRKGSAGSTGSIAADLGTLIAPTAADLPVKGTITQEFDTPVNYTRSGRHGGVDIAVPVGTPIPATIDGTVIQVQDQGDTDYGKEIVVQGSDGLLRRYGHLSQFNVKPGQQITAGNILGLSGSTGRSSGPHLHVELIQPTKK